MRSRLIISTCRRSFSTLPDLNETLVVTKSCVKVMWRCSIPFPAVFRPIAVSLYLILLPQRIKQLQKTTNNENLVLRLSVEGGGCSGFQYIFKMEDRVKAVLEAAANLEEDEEVLDDR